MHFVEVASRVAARGAGDRGLLESDLPPRPMNQHCGVRFVYIVLAGNREPLINYRR